MISSWLSPDAAYDEAEDAKTAAAAYLKANYIDKNKIITNGSNGVEKSSDGLSYKVGLKTSPTATSNITSIRLKTEGKFSSIRAAGILTISMLIGEKKRPSLQEVWGLADHCR